MRRVRPVAGRHACAVTDRWALWSDRHAVDAVTALTRHGFGDRLEPWGGGRRPENAAYPLTVCAEKTAVGAAATAGYRPGDIVAIGISASPCGGCRQWLHEWRVEQVSFRREDGSIATYTGSDLLPDTWNLPE